MGNCQAAEAATVVIQHPGGNRVERMYRSVSANDVMRSNPGHFVAMVVTPAAATAENGAPVKQLKLLRSEDILLLGQVYRLVSFEDVLKEFAAKKCVKLGKLLKQSGGFHVEPKMNLDTNSNSNPSNSSSSCTKRGEYQCRIGSSKSGSGGSSSSSGVGKHSGQWRPALQTIAELATH